MRADEINLLEPDPRRRLPQDRRKRVILHQGVGQLEKAPDGKRPQAHGSTGKGFERIRVEERKIVFNVQRLHPFRVPMRQRRAEADRVKSLELPVDALRLPQELRSGAKRPAVVVNPVHANLEPALAQLLDEVEVETVVLGDEVKG